MAENRNITWDVTIEVNSNVTTPFKLYLKGQNLDYGKWRTNPPSEIEFPRPGQKKQIQFAAEGAACTASGTQGKVIYETNDNPGEPTTYEFFWDIPFSSANSGNVLVTRGAPNNNFNLDNGGGVPKTGNSVTVNVKITQINPVI